MLIQFVYTQNLPNSYIHKGDLPDVPDKTPPRNTASWEVEQLQTVMKTQVPKLLEGLGKDQVWGLPGANSRGSFPILCLEGDGGSGVTWANEELSRGGQLTPPCPLLSSHLLLEQWVACHPQGQPGGGAQLKPVGRMTSTLEFIQAKMCVLSHSFTSFNTCSASTMSQHCSRCLGNQQ